MWQAEQHATHVVFFNSSAFSLCVFTARTSLFFFSRRLAGLATASSSTSAAAVSQALRHIHATLRSTLTQYPFTCALSHFSPQKRTGRTHSSWFHIQDHISLLAQRDLWMLGILSLLFCKFLFACYSFLLIAWLHAQYQQRRRCTAARDLQLASTPVLELPHRERRQVRVSQAKQHSLWIMFRDAVGLASSVRGPA